MEPSLAAVSDMVALPSQELPGVTIYNLGSVARRGQEQEVLVVCEPDAEIPLHTHSVDAHMYITSGSGTVLSTDSELDQRSVSVGKVVFFKKNIPHGFRASSDGLTFVSRNGGICDEHGDWDIDFDAKVGESH